MKTASRQEIAEAVLKRFDEAGSPGPRQRLQIMYEVVAESTMDSGLSVAEKKALVQRLYHAMFGLDILQPLLDDPEITEIMVNRSDRIYIEKNGRLQLTALAFDDQDHLLQLIHHCFGQANRALHGQQPFADIHLKDGARVHAILPPAALSGPALTIRKYTGIRPDMDALIEQGSLTSDAADFLRQAVQNKLTVFICGGTSSGKTTLLNILSASIPHDERIITIEDSAELDLPQIENLVRLEAQSRAGSETVSASMSDLIRTSLRMRPDRIIVGEVRGAEAFDMLQAMNTGHPGSLCTGHANSCRDMLSRLCLMVLMAVQLPWEAIRGLVASALDLMVFLRRSPQGIRSVAEIAAVEKVDDQDLQLRTLFTRTEDGDLVHV
ncbi:MAG: ATPase, T2SS/T4P/T4SS family [Eubacteriales bacterium]|nr:ATPase, T2SS/T4P/T4SS family [Eubacteriales bacterium]